MNNICKIDDVSEVVGCLKLPKGYSKHVLQVYILRASCLLENSGQSDQSDSFKKLCELIVKKSREFYGENECKEKLGELFCELFGQNLLDHEQDLKKGLLKLYGDNGDNNKRV